MKLLGGMGHGVRNNLGHSSLFTFGIPDREPRIKRDQSSAEV